VTEELFLQLAALRIKIKSSTNSTISGTFLSSLFYYSFLIKKIPFYEINYSSESFGSNLFFTLL
jgi:hypothetical protein